MEKKSVIKSVVVIVAVLAATATAFGVDLSPVISSICPK